MWTAIKPFLFKKQRNKQIYLSAHLPVKLAGNYSKADNVFLNHSVLPSSAKITIDVKGSNKALFTKVYLSTFLFLGLWP